ncbi:MAG: nicotinate-nucleotide adenylyltransferase [Pirellulaceae bacterium]|nr:nicotinate-nucleotide adenylyltransferase [Pirellulaceae bacterium]
MRIGIYGGSFDPVHIVHLIVAETVREQVGLDRVVFIPAFQSPLKLDYPPISGRARLEMLQLAVGGHPSFAIDDRELLREGISFTVDTLKELRAEQPDAEWFLMMGADALVDLDRWKAPNELCTLAIPVVVARGGMPLPDFTMFEQFVDAKRMIEIRKYTVEMPQMEISSRDIRQRIQEQKSIRYLVPASVEAYIRANNIYP